MKVECIKTLTADLLVDYGCRYFDIAGLVAIDWYRMLMRDVEVLCHQQVS